MTPVTGWLKYVECGSPGCGTLERGVPSPPRQPARSPMTFSSHLLSFGVGALYDAAPFCCLAPSARPTEPRADGGAGDARPTDGASSGASSDWYVVVPGVWRLSGGDGVTMAGRMNGCDAGGDAMFLSLPLSSMLGGEAGGEAGWTAIKAKHLCTCGSQAREYYCVVVSI